MLSGPEIACSRCHFKFFCSKYEEVCVCMDRSVHRASQLKNIELELSRNVFGRSVKIGKQKMLNILLNSCFSHLKVIRE